MKPEILIDRFEKTKRFIKYEKDFKSYRLAFSGYNVRNYRGISREVVSGFMARKLVSDFYDEKVENRAALIRWHELKKNDYENEDFNFIDVDEDLLPSIEFAREVYGLLDFPEQYEIIMVKRQNFGINSNTLGFDIGYWGGDHFSLIADTLVIPMWHCAPDEDHQELRQRFMALNPNILFNNPEDAREFKSWYKSKGWAETEGHEGEFCIIQVDRTP